MDFTIFSGCYNSAPTIERLFLSIKTQTFKEFEWIVFDDFSQDNTVELIENFIRQNHNIKVLFIKNKHNCGIKYCFLEALRIANGKYLVQWDHDDDNKPNQLEVFNKIISEYDDGYLAGVWALCEDQQGNLLGNKYSTYITVGNYFTHYRKYITRYGKSTEQNERMPCINISKLRKLEKYVQENFPEDFRSLYPNFRWAFLSMLGNKIIFINEVVRVYYINQNLVTLSNIRGPVESENIMLSCKHWINLFFKYLNYKHIYFKFKIYLSYINHGINADKKLNFLVNNVTGSISKLIISILYFPIMIFKRLYSGT